MVFAQKMILYEEPDDEDETEDAPPAEEEEEAEGGEEEEEEEEEEDLVDPLDTVREKCEQTAHCVHARSRLEACERRVGSRPETEEDCTEELFDFLHARDHCVAHRVFHNMK